MNHNTTIDTPHKELLRTIEVRPISRTEQTRWDTLIRQNHYLGFRSFVGESIRCVAESHEHWMDFLGYSKGFAKSTLGYVWHNQPKMVFVRDLHPHCCFTHLHAGLRLIPPFSDTLVAVPHDVASPLFAR